MEKSSLFYLGFVSKKIGFRGKISIKIENGNPNSYLDIDFIYVEIENQLIPYKVVGTNSKKNTFLELKIDELDNEEKINHLLKKNIFLDKKYLKVDTEKTKFDELVNFSAYNSKKLIGSISEILSLNTQNLMIIETEEKKEFFIPLVSDFIKKVDKKNRIVFFQLPDGLVDLNNNS